jgi:hypothetical protein
MITIESAASESKPRGARKATLTKKAAAELRGKIESALQGNERRLGPSAVAFLDSIRQQLAVAVPRLSKSQRDVTDEVLFQASFGEQLVILEGEAIVELVGLFPYATADGRVSTYEEYFLLDLRRRLAEALRLEEPVVSFSGKQWRIIEEIKQKTYFGLPGEPPPIDPDGIVENEDPDGWPPERDEMAIEHSCDWGLVGVYADDEY